MIDFNSMATCLGLFYAQRLENHVHCIFIFTFLCSFLRVIFLLFLHMALLNTNDFKKRYVRPIDGNPNCESE